MKVESYMGIEQPVITIQKATDLYPLLDYIQSKMLGLSYENGDGKASECATFISTLMEQAEKEGYGSFEDIDNIEH